MYKLLTSEMKILLGLFVTIFALDSIQIFMALNSQNYRLIIHVYTLIEYSCLMTIFSYWQKSPVLKKNLRLTIPLFVVIWIAAKIFVEDPIRFDSFTSSLEGALLAVVSAYTLFTLIEDELKPAYRSPRFWVSCAALVYFSGNLVLFALTPMIAIWITHSVLNIISNLCYAGGFFCLRSQ